MYNKFRYPEERKKLVTVAKELSATDKKLITEAEGFHVLSPELRKKLILEQINAKGEPTPLRKQPLGLLMNFIYQKTMTGGKAGNCSCIKINGTAIQDCEPK